MSLSHRLHWIENELESLEGQTLRRFRSTRESPPIAGLVQIDGRQFINFGSNDYLGIAASEELVRAVHESIGQLGFGSGASPVISGRGTLHRRLEIDLANFENTESALLFPTGYAANVGTICSLVGPGDAVFSDQLNHASIIDGCRLSGARIYIYPHADVDQLRHQMILAAESHPHRRSLIVTDGLFSMDGDIAPLAGLCDLADQFDAMLMVDEAHATGVLGDRGRGTCEFCDVEGRVDVRIGTLGKALGTFGGFVAGSTTLIDWIFNNARPYVFSTAQPEVVAAASLAALRIVANEPERRRGLLARAGDLRKKLASAGFDVGKTSSHIIPVVVGAAEAALHLHLRLKEHGIYVPGIRPPTVPAGQSRLRIGLSSAHSAVQIDTLVEKLSSEFASNRW